MINLDTRKIVFNHFCLTLWPFSLIDQNSMEKNCSDEWFTTLHCTMRFTKWGYARETVSKLLFCIQIKILKYTKIPDFFNNY